MNNPTAELVVSELNKLTPLQMIEDPRVEEKFVTMYNKTHGDSSGDIVFQKKKFDFLKMVQEKKDVKECTALSIYGCFLEIAVYDYEIGSDKPHVYFIPRSVNIGTKKDPVYEKRLNLDVTPHGEIVQRMRAGQIAHADNPVIVYEGDAFRMICDEKGRRVVHEAAFPRKSKNILAGYIRIVRTDGSVEMPWLLIEDLKRLEGYSARANSYYDQAQGKRVTGNANDLYKSNDGQIDPGFFEAKVINHAFDSYPKVKVGSFTTLASKPEKDPEEEQPVAQSFDTHPEPEQTPQSVTVPDNDDVF